MSKVKAWRTLGIGMIVVSISSCAGPGYSGAIVAFLAAMLCLIIVVIGIAFTKEKDGLKSKDGLESTDSKALAVRFEEKKTTLKSSPHYKLIERAVEKYVATNRFPGFGNLLELLKWRGFEFDTPELWLIIREEREHQEYEVFRKKILYNHPTELNQYISNYLDAYETDKHELYIGKLKNLLNEEDVDFNEDTLLENIRDVKKEVELEIYEKKLLYSDSHYSIDDLDMLSGQEFEDFLSNLFGRMGYSVEQTKLSGDQGADLILSKFGSKVVVQAKQYSNKVTNKAIQEVVAAIKHYGADRAMVVTTSEFTEPATKLAQSNGVELVDRYSLEKLMQQYL